MYRLPTGRGCWSRRISLTRSASAAQASGTLTELVIPHLAASPGSMDPLTVEVTISPLTDRDLRSGSFSLDGPVQHGG